MKASNLVTRTVSGIIFLCILLSGIIFHPFGYGFIFLFVIVAGLHEFYNLLLPKLSLSRKISGYMTAIMLFALFYLKGYGLPVSGNCFWILTVPVAGIFIAELYARSQTPFSNISGILTGVIYVALPFSLTTELTMHEGNYDYRIFLALFIYLWSNDVGAYCFGMIFGRGGKHKLFERISPKKSWEGFFGGIVTSLLAAFILSSVWDDRYVFDRIHWFVLALTVSLSGTFGDLVESMLKRSAGVKDSGKIMPGHGGILDRFDSALFAFPSALAYIYLFNINILSGY
ncbi:MAG: phosphatidate cytidylyltransferase [Prevotellaceae bacterium]|jgi:phosphatidate cytidylyltransferase|nr:phosphatidate cytidylyltransferase [Prevotellaceae bacterium]